MQKYSVNGEGNHRILWQKVLDGIGRCKSSELEAVRIYIYVLALRDERASYRRRIRSLWSLSRLFKVHKMPLFSEIPKGMPLASFFFNTFANVSNLRPVAEELSAIAGVNYLVAKDVSVSPAANREKTIGIEDVIIAGACKAMWNRLREGCRLYGQLREAFVVEPHIYSIITSHRLPLIFEITRSLCMRAGSRLMLREAKPSCVVSTTDFWPIEHAFFSEARNLAIPSYLIQHGVTNVYWWPLVSENLFVWGEPFRDEMIALGAPQNRIHVGGMPAADGLFNRAGTFVPRSYSSPKYLLLSQTHTFGQKGWLGLASKYREFLNELLENEMAAQWLVKLHPSESDEFYRGLTKENFEKLEFLPKSISLKEALSIADVTCTLFSTAGLEAMIMKRPLVVLNVARDVERFAWWPTKGGGVYIHSAVEMLAFCSRAARSAHFLDSIVSSQSNFLESTFANPGTAANSIARIIAEKCGTQALTA